MHWACTGGVQQDVSALSPALIRATRAPLLSSTSHAVVGRPTLAPAAAPVIAYSGSLAKAAAENLEQDAEDRPAQPLQGADQGQAPSLQLVLQFSANLKMPPSKNADLEGRHWSKVSTLLSVVTLTGYADNDAADPGKS